MYDSVTRWILCVLVSCFLFLTVVAGECTPFPEVDENNYDRNYSSIDEDTKRPLGFLRSTFLFNNQEGENPCFSMNNLTSRSVEIKFETIPDMKLCVSEQSGTKLGCQEGRFKKCLSANAETMEFTFFCEVSDGCSESDVNFWVRLVRGPSQVDDPEGMWCQWRDDFYPESLATLPPGFTPPPTPPGDVGGSTCLTTSGLLLITMVTITIGHWLKL